MIVCQIRTLVGLLDSWQTVQGQSHNTLQFNDEARDLCTVVRARVGLVVCSMTLSQELTEQSEQTPRSAMLRTVVCKLTLYVVHWKQGCSDKTSRQVCLNKCFRRLGRTKMEARITLSTSKNSGHSPVGWKITTMREYVAGSVIYRRVSGTGSVHAHHIEVWFSVAWHDRTGFVVCQNRALSMCCTTR